jgi:hypothetical protein
MREKERESLLLLEFSQTSVDRPSDKFGVKVKTLGLSEVVAWKRSLNFHFLS